MSIDPHELLYAYTQGYFPMAIPEEEDQIYWFKPEQRGIIPLDKFHISKNLKRLYKSGKFSFGINKNFEEVMRACANRDSTWISEDIIQAYVGLHKLGHAMSFEVYQNEELVGGLYGVSMSKAFFGESMFHRVTDASKLALIYLVEYLKENGFLLLDTQYINDHLLQFGAIEVEAEDYESMLKEAMK